MGVVSGEPPTQELLASSSLFHRSVKRLRKGLELVAGVNADGGREARLSKRVRGGRKLHQRAYEYTPREDVKEKGEHRQQRHPQADVPQDILGNSPIDR